MTSFLSVSASGEQMSLKLHDVEYPPILKVEEDRFFVGVQEDFTHNLQSMTDSCKAKQADGVSFFITQPMRQTVHKESPDVIEHMYQQLVEGGVSASRTVVRAPIFLELASSGIQKQQDSANRFLYDAQLTRLCGLKYIVVNLGQQGQQRDYVKSKHQLSKVFNFVLDKIPDLTILIQNVANNRQRQLLGAEFTEIRDIIDLVQDPSRVGVMLDVQSAFQEGLGKDEKNFAKQLFKQFDETIGRQYLKFLYISDSQGEFGTRLGRSEQLGKGKIGKESLTKIVQKAKKLKLGVFIRTARPIEHLAEVASVRQWAEKRDYE